MSNVAVTCFADLKGALPSADAGGSESSIQVVKEHLRVCEGSAKRNNGHSANHVNDMFTVQFDNASEALSFATQLQQQCAHRPGGAANAASARVSLFQGVVEAIGKDVFGPGLEGAANASEQARPGEVVINGELYAMCGTLLGGDAVEKICRSVGEVELSGIKGSSTHTLYVFDWREHIRHTPAASIATHVYDHFNRAKIDLSNMSALDMNTPGSIIWPVVPRDLATAIHRAQVELIRLLVMLGWTVKVLIVDCGDEHVYKDTYIDKFKGCLSAVAMNRGIVFESVVRMTELYDPDYEHYRVLQALFRSISTRMTVAELMAINNKNYSSEVLDELRSKPTLTYIRPPLTIAAVLHLAQLSGGKCAIVSGIDESAQWKQAYNETGATSQIGALMIPVVKMNSEHQLLQQRRWPIWDSEAEVLEHISDSESNTAWWLYRMHAFLPAFPEDEVKIGSAAIRPEAWPEELSIPEGMDTAAFVNSVWPLLNPSTG